MPDFFDRIPKAELHLHLEGAIPLEALWTLMDKYGGDPQVPSLEALEARFQYRDFPHFIETWIWKNRFLREYEDFTLIAEAVARHLLAQNILYVEAFCSPADFTRHGLETSRLLEAIRLGLDRVPGIEVALVPDLVRDFGPERAMRTLHALLELRALGVIGIGIGGSEQLYPPEPFESVYAEARRHGLRTTAHAGEVAGAASVRGAVEVLEVDRIGHGTRAGEDPALLDLLAERQIPLEMCPLSNVRTGVVPGLSAHPLRRYLEHGLLVTVNTDDPAMFGTSLAGEYRQLALELELSHPRIVELVLNAIRGSWLEEEAKARRLEAFQAGIARAEAETGA